MDERPAPIAYAIGGLLPIAVAVLLASIAFSKRKAKAMDEEPVPSSPEPAAAAS